MGVKAVDDKTLEVTLTTPQPWFVQQAAHHSFLAVHKPTVDKFGDKWTEAANIVTNGPFTLERWEHNANIDIVKWDEWRDAASVKLTRVNGRMISDGTTAIQAFEAGELDVNDSLATDEIPRLRETETYDQYPGLGTYYYGFNVKKITDVKQRRAMSLAIDRRSIIDNIAQEDQLPDDGLHAEGDARVRRDQPGLALAAGDGRHGAGEAADERGRQPGREHQPLHQRLARASRDRGCDPGCLEGARDRRARSSSRSSSSTWSSSGRRRTRTSSVYRLGWIGDFVDAINFLELWTCDSGNNSTNYCNKEYDALIEKARSTPDNDARYELYAQAEEILGGENGDMPIMPIYYYTYTAQESESVKESFEYNLLNQADLTKVVVTE